MRIGIPDLEKFSPRRGIGRSATRLVSEWTQAGHEVVSLSPRKLSIPVLRNINWGLQSPLSNIDVIFMPNFLGAEILFFVAKSFPSVTVVHDIGGIDCREDISEGTMLTPPFYRLSLMATCRSTQIITVSNFTKNRLTTYYPNLSQKVSTVYNGVDHDIFFPRERIQSRATVSQKGVPITVEDFIVIYVGAEYARKNLSTLIDSFSILKSRIPSAKLLKVGAAHSPASRALTLEKIKQTNLILERDVIFIEEVDDEFLANLYGSADVFVSTSKYEGFGLPLLEAMACGLPAVVSNAGALPEIGSDAVTYVDRDDAITFANGIEKMALSQHSHMVERSVARAANFRWDKTASAILKILATAADR